MNSSGAGKSNLVSKAMSNDLKRAEDLIVERLLEGPTDVLTLGDMLSDNWIAYGRTRAKEIAWNMVEKGKAQFKSDWNLELISSEHHLLFAIRLVGY